MGGGVVKPYDSTSLADQVVGVPDYSQAKAGKAAETIAHGIGQLRQQTASNFNQNQNNAFNLLGGVVGAVGNVVRNHIIAQKQTAQLIATSNANQDISDSFEAMDGANKVAQQNAGNDPEEATKQFSDALATNVVGQDSKPMLVNSKGQPADRESLIGRINANQSLDASTKLSLIQRVQSEHRSQTEKFRNAVYDKQATEVGAYNDMAIDRGAQRIVSATGSDQQVLSSTISAIRRTTEEIDGNRQAMGQARTDKAVMMATEKLSNTYFESGIRQGALADNANEGLAKLNALEERLSKREDFGLSVNSDKALVLQGHIENAKEAQVQRLENAQIKDVVSRRADFLKFHTSLMTRANDIPYQKSSLANLKSIPDQISAEIAITNANPNYSDNAKARIVKAQMQQMTDYETAVRTITGNIQKAEDEANAERRHKESEANKMKAEQQHLIVENRRVANEQRANADRLRVEKDRADTEERDQLRIQFDNKMLQYNELDPVTQQNEIVSQGATLAAEISAEVMKHPKLQAAVGSHQNAIAKKIDVVTKTKLDPGWGIWPQATVKALSDRDKKEAIEISQRKQATLKIFEKEKAAASYKIQRTHADMDVYHFTGPQQEAYDKTMGQIMQLWSDGKIDDAKRNLKINQMIPVILTITGKPAAAPVAMPQTTPAQTKAPEVPGLTPISNMSDRKDEPTGDPLEVNKSGGSMNLFGGNPLSGGVSKAEAAPKVVPQQKIHKGDPPPPNPNDNSGPHELIASNYTGSAPGFKHPPDAEQAMAQFRSTHGSTWQAQFAKPGPYKTELTDKQEEGFQKWVAENNIPFHDGEDSDYDMRGYYKDVVLKGKDLTGKNKNDGKRHFPDTYKTPYHESFSRQSKYSKDTGPNWNGKDQLVGKDGHIYFDEPAVYRARKKAGK